MKRKPKQPDRFARLRVPSRFASFAARVGAMERAFGRDRSTWPQWGHLLLAREVAASLKGAGYG